jgi:hypothetical protein
MYFNTTLGEFVSPQLALWPSSGTLFAADPAAGWAVWQELVMAAKNPWCGDATRNRAGTAQFICKTMQLCHHT